MANQSGIAITIKAFLPTGKTLDEQLTALTIVKDAHGSRDYTALLKTAEVEEVKTEQKTRRVEEKPAPLGGSSGTETKLTSDGDESGLKEAFDGMSPVGDIEGASTQEHDGGEQANDEDGSESVPAFLKNRKKAAA